MNSNQTPGYVIGVIVVYAAFVVTIIFLVNVLTR